MDCNHVAEFVAAYDGGSFNEGEVLALPVHQEGVDLIAGQGLFGARPLD